jgi:hypothetical protein
MWFFIALLGGTVAVALVVGWQVHRYQRDIDAYERREFRTPLVFRWPPL